MGKEYLANFGPTVECSHKSDHSAKAKAILDRTPHSPTEVLWPDNETRSEAVALTGITLKPGCFTCHLNIIDGLRKLAGLHSIRQEVTPPEYKRRLDICRGNERKGIPKCEHLAFTNMNCGKCLCFIDLKARMKSQRCPENKWAKA